MRRVELNFFENSGDFVESVRSSSPAFLKPFTQGDTIEWAVTKVVRPEAGEAGLAAFIVKPWAFTSIRISFGYIDRTPEQGSFKLRVVGVGDTALITWPTLAGTAAEIAAAVTAW